MVPVEVIDVPSAPATLIQIVSPSGYRLEGLTLDEALRALARLR
jgi:hypothetical protein